MEGFEFPSAIAYCIWYIAGEENDIPPLPREKIRKGKKRHKGCWFLHDTYCSSDLVGTEKMISNKINK